MTIFTNYNSQEAVDKAFIAAWSDQRINTMKSLLTSPSLHYHFDMNYSDPQAHKHTGATMFMEVCARGDLDFVQFILTDQNIKHKIGINDNGWYDSPLSYAVNSGNLELVKYILNSDLPENAQIMPKHVSVMKENGQILEIVKVENWPLERAFEKRNFEMIDYLLASPELKEHAKLTPEIMEDLEYNHDQEMLTYIKQKGYKIQEHDSSYYTKDKNGNSVKMKFYLKYVTYLVP